MLLTETGLTGRYPLDRIDPPPLKWSDMEDTMTTKQKGWTA
jgi:hypothetical protein